MSTSIEETRWSCRLSRISRGRQSCRASKAQGMNWQHFTQPDLICTVHMSNSQANAPTSLTDPSGSVPNVVHCASQTSSSQESYKVLEQHQTGRQLRVVLEWKLPDEAGTSLGEKAARIVLEDIDFTPRHMPAQEASGTFRAIHAVHRDKVVGLRYADPQEPSDWRRCQLLFQDEADRCIFVSLIQADCHVSKVERKSSLPQRLKVRSDEGHSQGELKATDGSHYREALQDSTLAHIDSQGSSYLDSQPAQDMPLEEDTKRDGATAVVALPMDDTAVILQDAQAICSEILFAWGLDDAINQLLDQSFPKDQALSQC